MRSQTILTFHGIGTPSSDLPVEEHPYWVDRDFFDEIVAFVAKHPRRSSLVLTFDDGNASDVYAAERLKSHGIAGKFFLLTEQLGRPRYVNLDEARQLDRSGFEVGLHGRSHVDWRYVSDSELDAATVEARSELAEVLGKPVTSAAVPFGAYNRRILSQLRRQNFRRVYTSDAGPTCPDMFLQRRTTIKACHGIEDVVAVIDDRVGPGVRLRRAIGPIVKRWR